MRRGGRRGERARGLRWKEQRLSELSHARRRDTLAVCRLPALRRRGEGRLSPLTGESGGKEGSEERGGQGGGAVQRQEGDVGSI